jgi:hypothetical protein
LCLAYSLKVVRCATTKKTGASFQVRTNYFRLVFPAGEKKRTIETFTGFPQEPYEDFNRSS